MSIKKKHNDTGDYTLHGAHGLSHTNNFLEWIEDANKHHKGQDIPKNRVASSVYLVIRKNDNKLVGMVDIRHELSEYLKNFGGHIGYGVLVSERKKGYATEILRLALEKSKELGISKVLVTCNKDNIGSAKTIQKNGGILENEVFDSSDNKITQRYWIKQ